MSDVAIVCLTVVPATYALLLYALARLECRPPRLVAKGRNVTVTMTDVRAVIAGSDAPQPAVTPYGVVPAELVAPSWRELGPTQPTWHTVPARELRRGRRR